MNLIILVLKHAKYLKKKAIELYTESLKLKPNDTKSLYRRGRAYEELKDFDNAVSDFNKVLEKSSYPECREISTKIAVSDDNSEKLNLFIKRQDYLRKIDINEYYSQT